MTNVIQAQRAKMAAQHQVNIVNSLMHRIEVARATHNFQLLRLLEQEQKIIHARPIYTKPQVNVGSAWWSRAWQHLQAKIANRSKLQAYQVADDTGTVWWYGFDPKTGQSVYTDSESELRSWIESNHWKD